MKTHQQGKQLITVILKDVANNTFMLHKQFHTDSPPFYVENVEVTRVAEWFFDQTYQALAKVAPKDFMLYYQVEKQPPKVAPVRFTDEEFTVSKCVIGHEDDAFEETSPYTLDIGEFSAVIPPDEFPDKLVLAQGIDAPEANTTEEDDCNADVQAEARGSTSNAAKHPLSQNSKYMAIDQMLSEANSLIENAEDTEDDDAAQAVIEALDELDRRFDYIYECISELPVESEEEVNASREFTRRLDQLAKSKKEKLQELGCMSPDDNGEEK